MSTLYRLGEEEVILITGAPDVLFRLCQYQQTNDGLQPSDQPYREGRLKSMPGKVCAWWLRFGNLLREGQTRAGSPRTLHDGVILLGIAGNDGSTASEAITAIADCLQADPRENDHWRPPANGHEHWANVGIGNAASAITGRELEAMDDRQLSDAAQQYDIFARTSPEDKSCLVQAPAKAKQEVVGMTGDGVNDAPALAGGWGIAMGIMGRK